MARNLEPILYMERHREGELRTGQHHGIQGLEHRRHPSLLQVDLITRPAALESASPAADAVRRLAGARYRATRKGGIPSGSLEVLGSMEVKLDGQSIAVRSFQLMSSIVSFVSSSLMLAGQCVVNLIQVIEIPVVCL